MIGRGFSRKTAEDIQDEIYDKMSAAQKIRLGSDFSMYCLKQECPEGTPVYMWFLKHWLKKNRKIALLRLFDKSYA